jgi:YHS domain-containing protein
MMNKKNVVFCILCAGLITFGLTGCKEDAPADLTEAPKNSEVKVNTVDTDTAKPDTSNSAKNAELILKEIGPDANAEVIELLKQIAANGEPLPIQTTCPIRGDKIKKDISVEYKGKNVYFCCTPCKEKFNADPEQFISKLPQFKK